MIDENEALTPTVVLYDIMYETATRLRGRMVRLQDENPARAADYTAILIQLTDRVEAVDVDDRNRITAATREFRQDLERLSDA